MSNQLLKIPGNIFTSNAVVGSQTSGSAPLRNQLLKVKNISANYLDIVGTSTSGVQSIPRSLKIPGSFYTPLATGVTINESTWTPSVTYTFESNQQDINITNGAASVYPVTFTVGNIGTVTSVSFKLIGYSHPSAQDVGMVLYAPNNTKFTIISGGYGLTNDAVNATVTFAPTETIVWNGYSSGTYINYTVPFRTLTNMGPHGVAYTTTETYLNLTNAFTDTDANGTWSIYIRDYYQSQNGSLQSAQLIITI